MDLSAAFLLRLAGEQKRGILALERHDLHGVTRGERGCEKGIVVCDPAAERVGGTDDDNLHGRFHSNGTMRSGAGTLLPRIFPPETDQRQPERERGERKDMSFQAKDASQHGVYRGGRDFQIAGLFRAEEFRECPFADCDGKKKAIEIAQVIDLEPCRLNKRPYVSLQVTPPVVQFHIVSAPEGRECRDGDKDRPPSAQQSTTVAKKTEVVVNMFYDVKHRYGIERYVHTVVAQCAGEEVGEAPHAAEVNSTG